YLPPGGDGAARFAPAPAEEELTRLLAPVRVELAYGLRAEGAAARADRVLLALAEGRPWLVTGERAGGGRYLLLASPLAPEGGTLVAAAAMVPLVDRLVGAWTEGEGAAAERTAGEPVPLPGRATAVERPDGTREAVEGGAPYRGATRAGIYRVLSGDAELAVFAVNPPAQETPLARLDDDQLEARLADWAMRRARDGGEWERMAYGVRRGGERWRALALLALALLIAEMLLAASGGRGARVEARMTEAAPAGAGGSWHTRS
ncbi:MAG TPA: hypothetical protein VMK65_13525, partial [Longimicrobiales bacterium]|nr:hypothetical protein [Longimicrobiales bacterium]